MRISDWSSDVCSSDLYVRRVFITDRCDELVPSWLRFLRGVVDSADLPLNVSREMLQHNPVVARIRQAITRRVLGELEQKARSDERRVGKEGVRTCRSRCSHVQ